MPRTVRIAVVAPETYRGDDEWRNASQAVDYIAEAASGGARLVLFPEGYPGPTTGPMSGSGNRASSPLEFVRQAAAQHRTFVACGQLDETQPDGSYYLSHKLIGPNGEVIFDYRRCQPTPPALNAFLYGGRRHVLPGNRIEIAKTSLGTIGMVICSELKVPELARIQMLRGAEILLVPVGGGGLSERTVRLADGRDVPVQQAKMNLWTCIAQARATENMIYVALTANAGDKASLWGSCVASPEQILARSEGPGVVYADLDLERLTYLRGRSWRDEDYRDAAARTPILTDPGQQRDRRPELYKELVAPQVDAFDYHYSQRGLDHWREFDGIAVADGDEAHER
jgi:predicted amidohydrolase